MMTSWNVGWFIGTLFVIVNLLGQLVPCGMILAKKKTDVACGILVFIIILQVSEVKPQFRWKRVLFLVHRLSNHLGATFLTSVSRGRNLFWITSNICTSLYRSCSLIGGLILLMVENRKEARTVFAGVPTMHSNAPKNYMQLTGRLLLVIMFITIVRFEPISCLDAADSDR